MLAASKCRCAPRINARSYDTAVIVLKTIEREKRNGVIYRKGHGTVVVPPFHSIVFIRFDQRASAEHTRGEKEREPCRLNQETNEMLGNSRGCIDFTQPRVRERSAVHPPPLPGNSGAADTLSIISKFAPTDLDVARPRQFAGIPALPSRKFSG